MLNAKTSRSFSPSHLIGKTFDENNLEEGLSVHKKNLHVKRIESEILQAGMTRLRKP